MSTKFFTGFLLFHSSLPMVSPVITPLRNFQRLNRKHLLAWGLVIIFLPLTMYTAGPTIRPAFVLSFALTGVALMWTISLKEKLGLAELKVEEIKGTYEEGSKLLGLSLENFINQVPSALAENAYAYLRFKKQNILAQEQDTPMVPVDPDRVKAVNEYVHAHALFSRLNLVNPSISKIYLAEVSKHPELQ